VKVLVTGGAGYVGSHAVRELAAAGHEIVIYDNFSTGHIEFCEGFLVVRGEIGDRELLSEALEDVDGVIHFAGSTYVGESMVSPRKYFRNNVEDALQLLDAVLASNVRIFVFSSSCAVYGIPHRLPIAESSRKEPINPYGVTKLFFEQMLSSYESSHGLKHVSLRYFNAAGADKNGTIGESHHPETHLIPLALRAVTGTAPPLKIFGSNLATPDGTCIRDYIHVSDLGRAHLKAVEYLAKGGRSVSLNLGTGQGTSIVSLVRAIERMVGRSMPREFAAGRPGDPPALCADASLAKVVLDWQPKFDLMAILESAWTWEIHGLPALLSASSATQIVSPH
jgi:UDP-glucose-4-epimerase GalE